MLGEFETDQFFVEKKKLANNLYVENLHHLSWHTSPANYVHQIISKKAKVNNGFKFELSIDVRRVSKWSIIFWKNWTAIQYVSKKLESKWKFIYKCYFKVIHSLVITCHK